MRSRRPGTRGRTRGDRGAATVLVLAMAGVLCFVAVALAGVAGVVRAHRSAQAAADLAALAAAAALVDGEDGCGDATAVAEANDAVLTWCAVQGPEVRVAVRVAGPRWPGRRITATAEARAGPA